MDADRARIEELAESARRLPVAERRAFRVRAPNAATLFGSGQTEQLGNVARAADAELVIVDASVTPIQQRYLETAIGAKVIDRTGLILEIFG